MMNSLIRFSGRNLALFEQLRIIDQSIEGVLQRVGDALLEFQPSLLTEWSDQGLWPKIEAYSLRYVLPVYELAARAQTDLTEILVAQLLTCVAWRHFDDCLDSHGSIIEASLASSLSCLRLHDYAQSHSSSSIRESLGRHYAVMADQAMIERTRAIELNEIWKRCSILMFPLETMANLVDERVRLLRCYINYAGIAHDVHDFISDAAKGVHSLPVAWMNEVNPDGVFSVRAVKELYVKLSQHVAALEQEAKELEISQHFPIMSHLWMESWRTIHHE
jgi:hypothetical protein